MKYKEIYGAVLQAARYEPQNRENIVSNLPWSNCFVERYKARRKNMLCYVFLHESSVKSQVLVLNALYATALIRIGKTISVTIFHLS